MVSIPLEWLYRNRLVPHTKNPEVPEKTYLPAHLPTWKSLFSLFLISTRATINKNKPNLKGMNIVIAQDSVSPVHGCMQYSHVHCLKGRDEASCFGEQKRNRAYFLGVYRSMLVFESLGFFAFTHSICGDPSIITITFQFVLKHTMHK